MKKIKLLFKFLFTTINYFYYNQKVKKIDYFNYKKLVYPNHKVPYGFGSVLIYGNWKAIARLKGSRFSFIRDYLEHGLSFYEDYQAVPAIGYVDRKIIKNVYTYSERRKTIIEQYLKSQSLQKNVIAIGPYIKGADFFYSATMLKEIKKKYGKILLVFPVHSMEGATTNYSAQDFIEKILEIQNQFDSVFVCIYWKDFETFPTIVDLCKQHNFTIVCNGHRSDPMFLSRQKDLIFLSDMIMTNGIGSYIGYGICMNKPVYYYNQEYDFLHIENPYEHLAKNNEKFMNEQKHKFNALFGKPSFEITQEQIRFIEEYWGTWEGK